MPEKTLKEKVEGFRDLLNGENCDFGRCACCNEKAVVYCNDSKAWVCGLHFTQEGDYKEYLILLTNFTALQEKGKEALTALEEELQRARDALRWKTVGELPIDGIPVVVQCFADDLETKIYFLCERGVNFRGEPDWFDVHTGQPIEFEPRQWKYADTAYTPEERWARR